MLLIDIIIFLIICFFIYVGYQQGVIKQLTDLIILFITSLLSGIISDKLFILLYKYLPFFNFRGKAEGLKSINIILWKILLYVLCILLIILIISKVFKKTKLEEKLTNTIIEAGIVSKIFGIFVSLPLIMILLFNCFLILLCPNFNLKVIKDSKISCFIMDKTPLLSIQNGNLYNNQKYIINRINKSDNTYQTYEVVNNNIINHMLKTNLIDKEIIKNIDKDNKLLGTKEESNSVIEDNESNSDSNAGSNDQYNYDNEKENISSTNPNEDVSDNTQNNKGDFIENKNYMESQGSVESESIEHDIDLDINFEDE